MMFRLRPFAQQRVGLLIKREFFIIELPQLRVRDVLLRDFRLRADIGNSAISRSYPRQARGPEGTAIITVFQAG